MALIQGEDNSRPDTLVSLKDFVETYPTPLSSRHFDFVKIFDQPIKHLLEEQALLKGETQVNLLSLFPDDATSTITFNDNRVLDDQNRLLPLTNIVIRQTSSERFFEVQFGVLGNQQELTTVMITKNVPLKVHQPDPTLSLMNISWTAMDLPYFTTAMVWEGLPQMDPRDPKIANITKGYLIENETLRVTEYPNLLEVPVHEAEIVQTILDEEIFKARILLNEATKALRKK